VFFWGWGVEFRHFSTISEINFGVLFYSVNLTNFAIFFAKFRQFFNIIYIYIYSLMGSQDLGYFDQKKFELIFIGFFLFFFRLAIYIYTRSQKAILKL
jgi:hypothetical protein